MEKIIFQLCSLFMLLSITPCFSNSIPFNEVEKQTSKLLEKKFPRTILVTNYSNPEGIDLFGEFLNWAWGNNTMDNYEIHTEIFQTKTYKPLGKINCIVNILEYTEELKSPASQYRLHLFHCSCKFKSILLKRRYPRCKLGVMKRLEFPEKKD
jgi:hypothetical protein